MRNVLGVSFSSRIVAYAVYEGNKLTDWKTYSFFDAWSDKKLKSMLHTLTKMAEQHKIYALSVKLPDRLPITKSFMQIVGSINTCTERRGIQVHYITLSEIKQAVNGNSCINKRVFMECLLDIFPDLAVEYKRECHNCRPYYDKLFEAVGAGYVLTKEI